MMLPAEMMPIRQCFMANILMQSLRSYRTKDLALKPSLTCDIINSTNSNLAASGR